jgi:uncharacterized protein
MIETIQQPWHWSISGLVIALIMLATSYFGGTFGVSRNFRTICTALGIGKNTAYFKFDWKEQAWNLLFLAGAIAGGFFAKTYLSTDTPIIVAESTLADLAKLGFASPTGIQPDELFSIESAMSIKGFSLLALGGLLIGFGTRYADGCTSGHAITGLSNLQIPSLIAVIGFFIGGLFMTHLLFPLFFN